MQQEPEDRAWTGAELRAEAPDAPLAGDQGAETEPDVVRVLWTSGSREGRPRGEDVRTPAHDLERVLGRERAPSAA